jgi:hypothetical protein
MSTVHAPVAPFNMGDYANAMFAAIVGPPTLEEPEASEGYLARSAGMPDESTVEPSDDDGRSTAYWAEFEQGMQEVEDDRAIHHADGCHAVTLANAIAHAKALVGNVAVKFTREMIVTTGGASVNYVCRVNGAKGSHYGDASNPAEAIENAIYAIDGFYLDREDNGFMVRGLVFVRATPFRTEDDARLIARRIGLDPSYLDSALAVRLPGVTDLRNPHAVIAAA